MNRKNRIAIISNWPDKENAEKECIERIVEAGQAINLTVDVINKNGYYLKTNKKIEQNELDFVVSLHFETPKCYDVYSYVALWNPLAFYFDWGYEKFSNNLVSHDDFLSCLSPWADDHIKRLIYHDDTRLPPFFILNHTLSSPIYKPKITSHPSLFYCGINWERVAKKKRQISRNFQNVRQKKYYKNLWAEKS